MSFTVGAKQSQREKNGTLRGLIHFLPLKTDILCLQHQFSRLLGKGKRCLMIDYYPKKDCHNSRIAYPTHLNGNSTAVWTHPP